MHTENLGTNNTYYSVISANRLNQDLVDELLYNHDATVDHSFEEYKDEAKKRAREEVEAKLEELEADGEDAEEYFEMLLEEYLEQYEEYKPCNSGVADGVHWQTSYFGDALNIFITASPVVIEDCPVCSPCAPNAGNLDSYLDGDRGSVKCFFVPKDWLSEEDQAALDEAGKE